MEGVFIADSVIHSADQYLVVGVQSHSGCLLMEFPAKFEYCFDERFVLQWGSGHFGDLWGVVAWFYFSCASDTSTSSYSGFVSVLSSSARSIAAVSSVYASARIGIPLCTCTTMWRCGGGGMWRGSARYTVHIWNIFSLCHSNASSDGYNFRILGSKTVSPLKSVKNSESSIKGDISIL